MPDEDPPECDIEGCTNEAVGVVTEGARCQYHMHSDDADFDDIRESWEEAYYDDMEDPYDEDDEDDEHPEAERFRGGYAGP